MADLRNRRSLLRAVGAGLLLGHPALSLAAKLAITPRQTAGPFYPEQPPADDDSDLTRVAGRGQTARGIITRMRGRILDASGQPVAGARVEIWQCDANGRYHHQRDDQSAALDPNFQGFGHTTTNQAGEYAFRTIKPVSYPGRTPHIHYKVIAPGTPALTTQMYVAGEAQNAEDFLYRRLSAAERERVTVSLKPAEQPDRLTGRFDIVIA